LINLNLNDFEFDFTIYFQVDRMDNAANKSYGAFPERLYAILDGEVVFAVRSFDLNIIVSSKKLFDEF